MTAYSMVDLKLKVCIYKLTTRTNGIVCQLQRSGKKRRIKKKRQVLFCMILIVYVGLVSWALRYSC